MMSLWMNEGSEWAVCDGPGPTGVTGYLVQAAGGGWAIKDDPQHRRFLDQQTAAATVLGKPLPGELRYYSLKRSDESGIVLTYPDVLDRILLDGWTVVASARTLHELDRR